ncbi:hypothetical protein BKA65DRAFT_458671 [Rhexocercosporidium sp. MPI-PUGE-AT-0058]|nr:hypothetical protein BKA65DRAFT_458671 [Rhexocercosporidium sp. MPI-PUGE-AT-0058]
MKPAASRLQIGFESLATEIVLTVLDEITDLPTLHGLINASPVAFRLFGQHGVGIVESILNSGNTTKRIPEIIRLITLIRSSSLPIHSLEEFQYRVLSQSMVQQRTSAAFIPGALPRDASPIVLRSILASATKISYLTSNCLDFYLGKLAAIEPEVLVDEKFSYRQGHPPHLSTIQAWKMRPEGQKLKLGKVEQASWIEVQRVERAFWRVEFFHDLKVAAARPLLSWPGDDLARLKRIQPKDFYSKTSYAEHEEIKTIVNYLDILRTGDSASLPVTTKLPDVLPKQLESPPTCPLSMPGDSDHDHLLIPAPGYSHWRGLSGHFDSPLRCISFDPFRRLGFALWSRHRMTSLGLLKPPNQGPGSKSTDYYFFVWKSILSDDEISDFEMSNKEREQRGGMPPLLEHLGRLGLH